MSFSNERSLYMSHEFMQSLEIMYKGMFGIFSVIIVITLIVIFIQKFENFLLKRKKSEE